MAKYVKFEWNDSYITGIRDIDLQHKELFQRIDNFILAMYRNQTKEEVTSLVTFLSIYIDEHFDTEEKIMKEFYYPHINAHQHEHNDFRYTFAKLKEDFARTAASDIYLAIRVEKEVKNWWEKHVSGTDMKYVPYLQNKING